LSFRTKEGKETDSRLFLVMDDCLSSKGQWLKDETIMEILMNGRHYDIMYFLTMQYPVGITPELRGNFDYIFLLKDDMYKKKLFEHYAGIFPDYQMFQTVFTHCTKDHGCLVIDNTSTSDKLLDKVFWYKANEYNNFKIGSGKYWEFHNRFYDKDYAKRKRDKVIDLNSTIFKKRNKYSLIVKKISTL